MKIVCSVVISSTSFMMLKGKRVFVHGSKKNVFLVWIRLLPMYFSCVLMELV